MSASPCPPALASELSTLSDRCVRCGLCLPVCPTYRVARVEAESPRGRIVLSKALADGELPAEPTLRRHLDHCLGCRSCEAVCPSGVAFGRLIELARTASAAPPDIWQRFLYLLIRKPSRILILAGLSRVLGLAWWLAPLARRAAPRPGLRRWLTQLPRLPALPKQERPPRPAAARGRVGLFRGCFASAFDRDTAAAAERLLTALGYVVVPAPGQGCCGALPGNAGHADVAEALAANTRQAFVAAGIDTLLVTATGCLTSLRERVCAGTSIRVREIGEFLASEPALADLPFDALSRRAGLHLPCTLRHMGPGSAPLRRLLALIPGLSLIDLPAQPACCGAGGSHFLRHPAMADELRAQQLQGVAAAQVDLLLTSNIGCRLHLGSGLRMAGSALPVLHPVTLLAQQLKAGAHAPTGH